MRIICSSASQLVESQEPHCFLFMKSPHKFKFIPQNKRPAHFLSYLVKYLSLYLYLYLSLSIYLSQYNNNNMYNNKTIPSVISNLCLVFCSSNSWRKLSSSREKPTSQLWLPLGLVRRDLWSTLRVRLVCFIFHRGHSLHRCARPQSVLYHAFCALTEVTVLYYY